MSFWKSLFGMGGGAAVNGKPATSKSLEHKGCLIEAQPYAADGQFQVAGLISKEIDGVRKKHKFVRADRYASLDDAAEFSISKGRQIIDQLGDSIFK